MRNSFYEHGCRLKEPPLPCPLLHLPPRCFGAARRGRGFLRHALLLVWFAIGLNSAGPTHAASSSLEKGFLHPPDSARPWVFWFWLNGKIGRASCRERV